MQKMRIIIPVLHTIYVGWYAASIADVVLDVFKKRTAFLCQNSFFIMANKYKEEKKHKKGRIILRSIYSVLCAA